MMAVAWWLMPPYLLLLLLRLWLLELLPDACQCYDSMMLLVFWLSARPRVHLRASQLFRLPACVFSCVPRSCTPGGVARAPGNGTCLARNARPYPTRFYMADLAPKITANCASVRSHSKSGQRRYHKASFLPMSHSSALGTCFNAGSTPFLVSMLSRCGMAAHVGTSGLGFSSPTCDFETSRIGLRSLHHPRELSQTPPSGHWGV